MPSCSVGLRQFRFVGLSGLKAFGLRRFVFLTGTKTAESRRSDENLTPKTHILSLSPEQSEGEDKALDFYVSASWL